MRGLYANRGHLALRGDLASPGRVDGETLVRVLRAGVCATDLALARGYMDFQGVLGHEFVGHAVEGPLAGKRVVGEINAPCGRCQTCRSGLGGHCPQRSVLGILGRSGAFAEELSLPSANLHLVPEKVSSLAATFVEPLAAAFQITRQLELKAGMRALVLGDGKLGCLCAQVLALEGLEVCVEGRHPERAARLAEGGVAAAQELVWYAPGAAPPGSYELVVEASGSPQSLGRAIDLCRPRGTVVLKSTSESPHPQDLSSAVVDELTLLGSRCGPFEPALSALEQGTVEVEALVDERYPLGQAELAMQRAGTAGILKVLIEMEGQ